MAAQRQLGFRDGLRAAAGGLKFVLTRSEAWGWALIPSVVAMALLGVIGSSSVALVLRLFSNLRHAASTFRVVLGYLATVGGVLGALLVSVLAALSLAQPLSGFALDALSRLQEKQLGGPERPDGAFLETAWRGLRVTLAGLAVGLPVIGLLSLVGLVVPGAFLVTVPLKFMVAGLLVAWDFLDYPFGLRAMPVRARLAWIRANFRGVLTFGMVSGAMLLVPLVGLLVLPIGVAGATQLVTRQEHPEPTLGPG